MIIYFSFETGEWFSREGRMVLPEELPDRQAHTLLDAFAFGVHSYWKPFEDVTRVHEEFPWVEAFGQEHPDAEFVVWELGKDHYVVSRGNERTFPLRYIEREDPLLREMF